MEGLDVVSELTRLLNEELDKIPITDYRYNFKGVEKEVIDLSTLPDKLIAPYFGCDISECYVGKNLSLINIGDIVGYNGNFNWSRLMELEFENRAKELNCTTKIWSQHNIAFTQFLPN